MQHLLTFIILVFVFHSKLTSLYLLQNVVGAECSRCRMSSLQNVVAAECDELVLIDVHDASMMSR